MDEQETYTLQELFAELPITIVELSKRSGINEVTLARMRDGAKTRRDTVNKLFLTLSEVYSRRLNIKNVTGINIMVNKRLEKKLASKKQGTNAA
jgi:predicted transcriptional regulator